MDKRIVQHTELLWKIGVLKTALGSLRRNHEVCEDGFYSCPKAEGYLGFEKEKVCFCGADEINALIDATLEETA